MSKSLSKKFLLTGGNGFIGGALAKRLSSSGHSVRVFDNGWRNSREKFSDSPGIEVFSGDIREPGDVKRACQDIDSVIHLAAINGTEFFYSRPGLVLEVGVKGISNVIDACRDSDVRELITMSSSEVYQTPGKVPTDEQERLVVPDVHNPRFSYGGSKIISELLTLHLASTFLEKVMVVRPHNVYGPDMGSEHVVPQFAKRYIELTDTRSSGEIVRFPIQGTGKETRSFVYIEDFLDGFDCVLGSGKTGEIYNIGSDQEVSIEELGRVMSRLFAVDIEIVSGELSEGGTLRRCPDISKLKSLGYRPKTSLYDGLKHTVDWYCKDMM